ncbi:MAG: NADPH:quinone reductase [Burkholderiaceae bacterium]
MRAAVYEQQGPASEVLRVIEMPTPEPGPGEVRVRLAFSGVNPSDVKSRAGTSARPSLWARTIPHSDGAGMVDAIGPGAPEALRGRRVWTYNAQWQRADGTAAEFVCLPSAQVVPLADGIPLEVGASIGIPLMTAFHAIASCGSLLGQTVLVPGAAGSVGLYAVQLARRAGARVLASVSSDAKALIARAAGAAETIDYRREDLTERVRHLTGGQGADAVIDLDAAAHAPRYGELLCFGGRAVIYGSNAPQIALPFGPAIVNFLSLYCFIVYRLPPQALRETITGVTALLDDATLQHPALAVFGLDQIAQAHERVERGAQAKVLIRL